MMSVYVLRRTYTIYAYDDTHSTTIVDGVYSTLQKARESAASSDIAMSSKDGLQWDEDGEIGEVSACPKNHYYMFCKCKPERLENWVYTITCHSLDGDDDS